jgi:REP element-mobilizing transposase RayT
MARQLRIEFENAFYHITSRGNLREKIFYDNQDKERFLKILSRTKERYGFVLHAYALMVGICLDSVIWLLVIFSDSE